MGKKRFVRKEGEVWAIVPSGTQGNQTLYQTPADKRETFVGLKGNLVIQPSGTVDGQIAVAIYLRKESQSTPTLNVVANSPLTDFLPNAIYTWLQDIDADVDDGFQIPLDIKTSRLMRENDSIAISSIASGAGVGSVNGNANLFIMEP